MAAFGACIEVTEATTIFISLLNARVEVTVSWEVAAAMESDLIKCIVQVCGPNMNFLDTVQFLQTLYASAPNLQQFMQSQVWPALVTPMELVWQRVGMYPSITRCSVEGLQDSNQLSIRQTVNRPSHLSTSSLSITLQVLACWKDMEADMFRISQHLHLLHTINPELCFKLQVVNTAQGVYKCIEHPPEGFRSLMKTPFKLATSLHHYYQPSQTLSVSRGKLHLVKGETVSLGSGTQMLQLCCVAALVPHFPVRSGRKVQADKFCAYVNVNMFGPGMLPLLQAASSIQPSLLANWSQYGLTLETAAGATGHSGPLLVPCLRYKPVGQRTGLASGEQGLHLFMLFEHVRLEGDQDGGDTGENDQWVYLSNMTAALRSNLVSIASIHSGKIFKAVHSTLNKLFCNYASRAELRHRVERVVPTVAEAVNSIVKHSNNQRFREQCSHLLQLETEDSDDIGRVLAHKLSQLAQVKLGLSPSPSHMVTSTALPPSNSQELESEYTTSPVRQGQPSSSAVGQGRGALPAMGQGMLLSSSAMQGQGVLLISSAVGQGQSVLPSSSAVGQGQREFTDGVSVTPGEGQTLHSSQQRSPEDFDALCLADCTALDVQEDFTSGTCDTSDTWDMSDTWDTNYGDTWEDTNDSQDGYFSNVLDSNFSPSDHAALPSQNASSWPPHLQSPVVGTSDSTETTNTVTPLTPGRPETSCTLTPGRPETSCTETTCTLTPATQTTCTLTPGMQDSAQQGEVESGPVSSNINLQSISEDDFMWD